MSKTLSLMALTALIVGTGTLVATAQSEPTVEQRLDRLECEVFEENCPEPTPTPEPDPSPESSPDPEPDPSPEPGGTPTAPIESMELVVTDKQTGDPVDCDEVETVDFAAVRAQVFVTVSSVPSEHWKTTFAVKRNADPTRPKVGRNTWNTNPFQSQNHGTTEDQDEPFIVRGNTMEAVRSHNNELTIFKPTTWTIKTAVTGDVSGKVLTDQCWFKTTQKPSINPTDEPLMDLPGPATHHEASASVTDMFLRMGPYPELTKTPFKCDGSDVHDGSNLRIEPVVTVEDTPSEHWDAHIQFLRFGGVAWDIAWPHQNTDNPDNIGNRVEITQTNNYDFGEFPDGPYEVRVRVAGQHSRNVFDIACPFKVNN